MPRKSAAQLDREINAVLYGHSTIKKFGSGPGSGTHASSHADDAANIPDDQSSTGWSHAFSVASQMRDSMESMGQSTSAIKAYPDGSFSFQTIQPQMHKDRRGNIYRREDEPGARRAADRGQLETIPEKLVSRHFDKRGSMTVTDHSKGAKGTHPDEIRAGGGSIREAQPWKARGSAHATRARAPARSRGANGGATLYVEGVGHRLPHGYEIHWNWIARRGGKKIDQGALTGGSIPEFYAEWPDTRGEAAVTAQMRKILRDEWITAGEFGGLRLSPTIDVSLRRSSSDEPIRGRAPRSHATKRKTIRIDIGNGLLDGLHSAGASVRLKKLREQGATDVELAKTGRLTFTFDGQRYEYRVTPPRDRREADAFEAAGTTDSPLVRALADIAASGRS